MTHYSRLQVPEYMQIGDLVERKPGVTYLAVRLLRAHKLIPADPNGTSDPFVIVEWDGNQQSTKVSVLPHTKGISARLVESALVYFVAGICFRPTPPHSPQIIPMLTIAPSTHRLFHSLCCLWCRNCLQRVFYCGRR